MVLTDLPRPFGGTRQPAGAVDASALVSQLGAEVASHLSQALERVTALTASGRIDRPGLRALRDEIDAARRAGIMGQQVVRLASGRVQLAHERVDVTALVRDALRQRAREISSRGVDLRQRFSAGPAVVVSDATLTFALLQTLLDWTFQHAAGEVDFAVEVDARPLRVRVVVRYPHRLPRPEDEGEDAAGPALSAAHEAALDTVAWRLLQQTAAVLGAALERHDAGGRTELAIEFPSPVPLRSAADVDAAVAAASAPEREAEGDNSQPLAGRHVVVLAARRDVRKAVREALRSMGLMIDFVSTVDEAQALCDEGLPHAVVYEASLAGPRFERLRRQWLAECGSVAFIEIAEQGRGLHLPAAGGTSAPHVCVGRESIVGSLPSALWFELSLHLEPPDEGAARGARAAAAASALASATAIASARTPF